MSSMPSVEKFMTPLPQTIHADLPLKEAQRRMEEYRIRHLPVIQDDGKVIGVLSDSDFKGAVALKGSTQLKAGDVMTPDPYRVHPNAALDEIVVIMTEQKFRCVIVEEEDTGKVVGIFTDNDALRVLGELLRTTYKRTK